MADDGREAELRDAFVQASSGQVGLLVLLVIVNLTVLWVLWSILSGN